MSDWTPQSPEPQPAEVTEEAIAYLLADARRRHAEHHERYGEENCRHCLHKQVLRQIALADERLTPYERWLFRALLRAEIGTLPGETSTKAA